MTVKCNIQSFPSPPLNYWEPPIILHLKFICINFISPTEQVNKNINSVPIFIDKIVFLPNTYLQIFPSLLKIILLLIFTTT